MTSIAHPPQTALAGAEPTSVYRYYDQIGVLIYVGITRQGMGRNVQHNGKAEWWPFVARQEVDHLPSRAAALIREKELIRGHRPPFNKQHNPDHAEMRATYLAYAISYSAQMTNPQELFQRSGKSLPLDILLCEDRRLLVRSRIEHGPIASLLFLRDEESSVRSERRKYGVVDRLVLNGPTVTIDCTLRSSKKHPVPEGGIGDATVCMGWDTKSHRPFVKRVLVIEGAFL